MQKEGIGYNHFIANGQESLIEKLSLGLRPEGSKNCGYLVVDHSMKGEWQKCEDSEVGLQFGTC